MAEQIIAINSTVEAVDGQATPVTDASQNDQDGAKGSDRQQKILQPVQIRARVQKTRQMEAKRSQMLFRIQKTSAAKPDPASITPTATGISIYISKRQSKLTLMQNKKVIGIWDAKLGRQSATGDKVKEGG